MSSSNERYYELLGIKKSENPDENRIKSSYKKMALKWHPDRNLKNKETAEKKFKEINEAYEILSNPEKRKLYDQFGEDVAQGRGGGNPFAGGGPFGGGGTRVFFTSGGGMPGGFRDPHDVFASVFGNSEMGNLFGQTERPQRRNKLFTYDFGVSLEELCNGCEKKMKVSVGSNSQIFKIPVKPGWKTGTKITFDLDRGDKVQFRVVEKGHDYLIRQGNNIRWVCTLKKSQIDKGVKLTIPTPMKEEKLELDTRNKYITHGTVITVSGKGMPIKGGPSRGDFLIEFRVDDK
jgi:DnaJ-class molecular chaperone